MTIFDANTKLLSELSGLYDKQEATVITDWIMERITTLSKIDRATNKHLLLSPPQEQLLAGYTTELLNHRPVQYVLHEAWFYGMKFYVDENVLIPRPETEELVEWLIKDMENGDDNETFKVLDIGTGSGCIPITIKNMLPQAEAWGCDTSDQALNVARLNADNLHTQVDFVPLDFLDEQQRQQLPKFDVIISNPPYVPLKDKSSMAPHVLNYEPHLALFVPDNDALVFYRAIALFAKKHLHHNGHVYVETHESLAQEVAQLFVQNGLKEVSVKKDLQGKERMVKASSIILTHSKV